MKCKGLFREHIYRVGGVSRVIYRHDYIGETWKSRGFGGKMGFS